MGPYESWAVETGDGASKSSTHPKTVRLSYLQLEAYRLRLMAEVRRVTESEEIRGPRQLGARLKTMRLPAAESEFSGDPAMNEFVRATLAEEVDLRANGARIVGKSEEGKQSIAYRKQVNADGSPSELVSAGYKWAPGSELKIKAA